MPIEVRHSVSPRTAGTAAFLAGAMTNPAPGRLLSRLLSQRYAEKMQEAAAQRDLERLATVHGYDVDMFGRREAANLRELGVRQANLEDEIGLRHKNALTEITARGDEQLRVKKEMFQQQLHELDKADERMMTEPKWGPPGEMTPQRQQARRLLDMQRYGLLNSATARVALGSPQEGEAPKPMIMGSSIVIPNGKGGYDRVGDAVEFTKLYAVNMKAMTTKDPVTLEEKRPDPNQVMQITLAQKAAIDQAILAQMGVAPEGEGGESEDPTGLATTGEPGGNKYDIVGLFNSVHRVDDPSPVETSESDIPYDPNIVPLDNVTSAVMLLLESGATELNAKNRQALKSGGMSAGEIAQVEANLKRMRSILAQ